MLFVHNSFSFYLNCEDSIYINSHFFNSEKENQAIEEIIILKCQLQEAIPQTHMFYTDENNKITDKYLINEKFIIRIYKNEIGISESDIKKIKGIGELIYIDQFDNTFTNEKDGDCFEGNFSPPIDNFKRYYETLVLNKLKPNKVILKLEQKKTEKQNHGELFVNHSDRLIINDITLEF